MNHRRREPWITVAARLKEIAVFKRRNMASPSFVNLADGRVATYAAQDSKRFG